VTWIETIPPEVARGDLAEIYRAIASARGGVAEIHRAQSLNPRALRAHLDLYRAVVFQRSTLTRLARERIAVVVSAANQCAYCLAHHSSRPPTSPCSGGLKWGPASPSALRTPT